MNLPKPALVTARAAERLPRLALILFCAAYVLPGVFHRDPWKNADVTAFGTMLAIAEGRVPWLAPTLGGLPVDAAPLPYGLGAVFIAALGPWLGPELAARFPFALLLTLALVCTWYATYHFARTDAAQPLPFAFGGEAQPVDYARAIADGALLALIASLGLLQLGHETTPELAQLAAATLFLYALAASRFRAAQPVLAAFVALPALAASNAPAVAALLGVAGIVACRLSSDAAVRRFAWPLAGATLLAVVVATAAGAWALRRNPYDDLGDVLALARQFAWFAWPAWPLALWTLWRWRDHLARGHVGMPLVCAGVPMLAWIAMGGSDRALMLALPPLAVLAAFTLPTLQRATASAIDWFSVFFFSASALAIWVIYVSLQTGVPAKPAANVARLAPGFVPVFSAAECLIAAAGTLAWIFLVRWRTGRNRHPLWKSMVLPAGGVALAWLLLMTLWLPLLDYARSYRPLVERLAAIAPARPGTCVATVGIAPSQVAAMEHLGRWTVDARTPLASTRCTLLMMPETRQRRADPGPGWERIGRAQRPTDRGEATVVFRRR